MILRIFLSVFLFTIISMNAFPQMHGKKKALQKMEELKKIKLIEVLQMNEETSIKFFTRRSEHMRKMEELNEAGSLLIEQIDDLIKDKNDSAVRKSIDEYLQTQDNLLKERQNFFKSVSSILTIEQMAKFVVFEERFRNEISGLLFRERKRKLR